MTPIPAQSPEEARKSVDSIASLTGSVVPSTNGAPRNRRVACDRTPTYYPILLVFSTLCAGLFCYLYITKPMVVARQDPPKPAAATASKPAANQAPKLMPNPDRLPGETKPSAKESVATGTAVLPPPPVRSDYEETNLKIQHILTADAPGGHSRRIDVEVPVLYQSRNLRWSHDELKQANQLLVRLMEYQDKTRKLQADGELLLHEWNQLVAKSIPSAQLRADSPSLPENQRDATPDVRPAELNSSKSIQLQRP